ILKNWSLNLKQAREIVVRKHIITIRNQDRKKSLTHFSFTTTPNKPSDTFNNISRKKEKKKTWEKPLNLSKFTERLHRRGRI
ncbi:hypothetical protein TorRG33x02_191610, partial [Trema orientale]